MNAPPEKRDLLIGLEQFEQHLLDIGVASRSEEGPVVTVPTLVARRDISGAPAIKTKISHSPKALRNDEDLQHHETVTLETVLRADFAVIDAELKDRRAGAARTASLGAGTSNAVATSTGELPAPREKLATLVSDRVGGADNVVVASRRSRSVVAGVVLVGLAGLGSGMAIRTHSSIPLDPSAINAKAAKTNPPNDALGADVQAQDPSALDPSPTALSGNSRPPLRAESGSSDQASVPATPNPTQEQPAALAAAPNPAAVSSSSPDGAPPRSDAMPKATVTPAPRRGPALASPASPAKTTIPTQKKMPKPSVAAKLNNSRLPERIAKPPKTTAPEAGVKPVSPQPPIAQTEPTEPKPVAAPESNGPLAYLKRVQQAVGSMPGVVKNWVGMDAGSHP